MLADLFAPLTAEDRFHPQYLGLRESDIHGDARVLMSAIMRRMGDPNGSFVRHFQGDGFHSRLFELACFAYLEEAQLSIDRSHDRPDFLASDGNCVVAVEAVTANPPAGQGSDISLANMSPLTELELFDRVNREFPRRIGKILQKKLRHNYHELEHCRGRPLVLMIAPFFESGSVFYTDDGLLYGLFGPPAGVQQASLPFFQREDAGTISAVLYCNQFTVSRFFRLATDFHSRSTPKTERHGTFYSKRGQEHHALAHFSHCLGSPGLPKETWAEGVSVFENPNAIIPLPRGTLPGTCYVSVQDGYVVKEISDFHPVVSFTHIHGVDEPG
jgi:hypothetical protein